MSWSGGLFALLIGCAARIGTLSLDADLNREPCGGAGAAGGASLTAGELRIAMQRAQQDIRSIHVQCRCDYGDDPRYPAGAAIYRTVACKRPEKFYYSSGKGHARRDWEDDPLWQRCYVSGTSWHWEYVLWRAYFDGSIGGAERLPESAQGELFLLATGIWPFDERPAPVLPSGTSSALRDVAKDEGYALLPVLELCDGRACHVLQNPNDKLWIDASRGCSLVAREVRQRETRLLVSRYELKGQREVAEGVWLPRRIHNMQYASEPSDPTPRLIIDSVIDVVDAHANDVAEEIFHFEPPPGALRLASRENRTPVQSRPGGLDHLDSLVCWIGRTGLGPREHEDDSGTAMRGFAAGLGAGAGAVILYFRLRMRCARARILKGRSGAPSES